MLKRTPEAQKPPTIAVDGSCLPAGVGAPNGKKQPTKNQGVYSTMRTLYAIAFFLLPVLALAGSVTIEGEPFAEDVFQVTTTSVGNTGACASEGRENITVVEVKSQAIYFTFTGATPTSSDHTGAVGDIIVLAHGSKFKAISQSGTATIKVTCFRKAG